jgi:hypothetical protein
MYVYSCFFNNLAITELHFLPRLLHGYHFPALIAFFADTDRVDVVFLFSLVVAHI